MEIDDKKFKILTIVLFLLVLVIARGWAGDFYNEDAITKYFSNLNFQLISTVFADEDGSDGGSGSGGGGAGGSDGSSASSAGVGNCDAATADAAAAANTSAAANATAAEANATAAASNATAAEAVAAADAAIGTYGADSLGAAMAVSDAIAAEATAAEDNAAANEANGTAAAAGAGAAAAADAATAACGGCGVDVGGYRSGDSGSNFTPIYSCTKCSDFYNYTQVTFSSNSPDCTNPFDAVYSCNTSCGVTSYNQTYDNCAPPPPTASISTDSTSIVYNTATTIRWSSTNAASCTVSPTGWTGTSGAQSTGNLTSSQTYTVSCSGSGGSVSASVTVSVLSPPPTVNLTTWSVFEIPEPVSLYWSSTNANSCTASGDWSGNKAIQGEEHLSKPRGNYTFTLTCTGPGGSASNSVTVEVIQVPQCSFTANPTTIIPPASSTLSWSCLYADSCSIDQGIGSVNNVSGTKEVRPTKTTDYTLTCLGIDGSRSLPATITVGFIPWIREVIPR